MKKYILILGFLLVLFISTSFSVEVTLLGAKQYLRTTGSPNVYTDIFPGRDGQGNLIIKNGEADGRNRISSAIIKINGVEIFGTSAFSKKVYNLEAPIALAENNSISVELRSSPGSYLILLIKQEINADGAAVIGPAGGTVDVSNPESPFFGISCNIPSGSLQTPKIITISLPPIADQLSNFLPANTAQAGIPVEFGPTGLAFSTPVSLTLTYFDPNDDGVIDGTDVSVDKVEAFNLIDQNQQDNIPILSLDKINHSATISVDHFSAYILTVPSQYVEYRWEMDAFSISDWVEESQYGPFPWGPTGQYQFNEPLFDGYSGLKIWARKKTEERIKLRTKDPSRFREGTYIWRTFVPPLKPGECGCIGAFLIKNDGTELDFEIGYGTESDRDYWKAKPGQYLCYEVLWKRIGNTRVKIAYCAVPIRGGWHELTINTKASERPLWSIDREVSSWEKWKKLTGNPDDALITDTALNWQIYCSSEILP